MDECLVQAAVDLSGRPYVAVDVPLPALVIGGFETELLGGVHPGGWRTTPG